MLASSSGCGTRTKGAQTVLAVFLDSAALLGSRRRRLTQKNIFRARRVSGFRKEVFVCLKLAGVDPHVDEDAGGVTEGNDGRPFEVTEEGVFAAGLAHEGNTGC